MTTKFFTKITAVALMTLLVGSNVSFAGDTKLTKGSSEGRFSAGLEIALPMGTFGDQSGTGFGLSVRYEMPMGDNLGLMGTIGYITYGKKTVDLGGGDSWSYTNSFIPIMAGAKYYFTEQQNGLYGMFQLGVTMFSAKIEETTAAQPAVIIGGVTYQAAQPEETTSVTGSSTNLTFAPGIGYHMSNLDFGLSYTIVSTTGASSAYLGLRAAYVFGGK